ncbi:NADH-quinone oxidoreductase subunit L [soil metagenome]
MVSAYQHYMTLLVLVILLAPLLGSIIAGLFGNLVGRSGAHYVTVGAVGLAFLAACLIAKALIWDQMPSLNHNLYTWGTSGYFSFHVGYLLDRLTALMLLIVSFVSLLVHVYSIGYMQGDPGYQRFFSYMSLFTFFMFSLVLANNFLQLYFGWEGVGLVSYLLIGFWFKKESANQGSLKAFLVNRVGDFGFILGIAAILSCFGTLDYAHIFAEATGKAAGSGFCILPGINYSAINVICILLFIGAMGKSAQMPLHVWLPESMEGPTPISALIHAATMVTAGVYMIARMSPLFEQSQVALSLMLVVGATGALFTGILAVVQHDIKRVIAYSTLSQLGYMVAAEGASAFSAGIFHLTTHACFKALLFLAAGSVIIAMHHEQDMRKMGNLWRRLPITYACFLIGALSLSAIPPFAGFYSKDSIIEAIQLTTIPGANYAYICVLLGTYFTALYIFRAVFMVFHAPQGTVAPSEKLVVEEPSRVVWIPLVILAIPSFFLGYELIHPILFKTNGLLGNSIVVLKQHAVLDQLAADFHGPIAMIFHALHCLPFWLAVAGIATAWFCYIHQPALPSKVVQSIPRLYAILLNKYGFDDFNDLVFVRGGRRLAEQFYQIGDVKIIDDGLINGSGRLISWVSETTRKMQTGYLYHYALVMIMGLIGFLGWLVWG